MNEETNCKQGGDKSRKSCYSERKRAEMFGKSTEQRLRKYIKLENGIPDACTFRNVIRAIDMQQLHTVFVEWMKNVVINGKSFLGVG